MKKINLIYIFLIVPFLGYNQELNNWQVGISINPFIFDKVSKVTPDKDTQNFPNGFGLGITIEKNWNDKWGFKTGIDYSWQNLKYKYNTGGIGYQLEDSDFQYYKVPLLIQYSTVINNKRNMFFIANQGFQVSILDYYFIYSTYDHDETKEYDYFFSDNKVTQFNKTADWELLNKYTYGLIGSVGIKRILSEKFSYNLLIRYEYDLTKSNNLFVRGPFSDNLDKNFRIGLDFGIQYHFSLKGCKTCPN